MFSWLFKPKKDPKNFYPGEAQQTLVITFVDAREPKCHIIHAHGYAFELFGDWHSTPVEKVIDERRRYFYQDIREGGVVVDGSFIPSHNIAHVDAREMIIIKEDEWK